jgi:four helix bundle protein
MKFSFEELEVWQKAVDFAKMVTDLTEKINTSRRHYRLIENLEAASTSVASNIAEGKGRYSKKEFIKFLYIARGSLFETITLLKIFHGKNWIANTQLETIEGLGEEISRMLASLTKSIRKSM